MQQRVASLIKSEVPDNNEGLLSASGSTVPADGSTGYQTGCTFKHTDGGAGTAFYVNEGSVTSSAFVAVAGLTAAQESAIPSAAQKATLDALTATATELNSVADKSANTEDISSAGALTPSVANSQVAGGEGFAVTLAAPSAAEVGSLKTVTLESITSGAVTMALTEVIGGTAASSASFDAAGETLVLVGVESAPATFKWLVIKEHGVTLS